MVDRVWARTACRRDAGWEAEAAAGGRDPGSATDATLAACWEEGTAATNGAGAVLRADFFAFLGMKSELCLA